MKVGWGWEWGGGGNSYLFRKKCPKVAIFQGKKVKIARLDVLRVRFSRKKNLLSSLTYIQIWISKSPLVDD
jgi:hypothetical protein